MAHPLFKFSDRITAVPVIHGSGDFAVEVSRLMLAERLYCVAAVLPAIPRVPEGQARERVAHMAGRLLELEGKYKAILFVCSMLDWPWVREAYNELNANIEHPTSNIQHRTQDAEVEETAVF